MVLHCKVLHCKVLHCKVLQCMVLQYMVLQCMVLLCMVLRYMVLHSTIQCCTEWHNVAAWYSVVLHCSVWYGELYCITGCTVVHWMVLLFVVNGSQGWCAL